MVPNSGKPVCRGVWFSICETRCLYLSFRLLRIGSWPGWVHDFLLRTLFPAPMCPHLLHPLEAVLHFPRTWPIQFPTGSTPTYADFTPPDYLRVCDYFAQVADSFVGRWFKLEGSGVAKERESSRFLVCPITFPFLAHRRSQLTTQTEIRAGLTTWVRRNTDTCPVTNN